ncbi:prepilin-type N-terminal cleavage/methylation domain-containing protein [Desulfosarcina sp. OttesenSCG-928-A07]|nr:prepilin-type N-terminal cleavage/methylation domain-containing protein [Desulfosarcina sp. OttesenSCG-928-A07]
MARHIKDSKKQANADGFTLVEVLVAMTIFSIGILGMAALQISSIRGNATSSLITLCTIMGENRVEMLMGLDYADAALSPGTHQPDPENDGIDNNFNGQMDESGEDGPVIVSYVVERDTPVRHTKTITHTIFCTHAFGERTITFVQVIPKGLPKSR